ncbi:hypothetical protein QY049_04115 [Bradyrhizobium sp. WYCCWR 13022]|uniref:hypothetical protein n=1 Tax=unclassified Bradyrhizobium TaxID=2631580 RepID=UPI00263A9DF9|nr:hypothetical protein [Bradyrhizobium sp. WYCCWR 13022]MDN4982409.1 hypothetical protein [Bradyrhizobium sp. WYCCWR 13022]
MLLLFLVDALWPKPRAIESYEANAAAVPTRIHSDRKWPERIVLDTRDRNPVVAAMVAETPAPEDVPSTPIQAPERESFAMLRPGQAEPLQSSLVKPQIVRAKGQRHAKRRVQPHRSLFAQRLPPQGWFGNMMW